MSAKAKADPYALGRHHGHSEIQRAPGPAPKRIVIGYGFWIFLLSDIIMFSAFFASVLAQNQHLSGSISRETAVAVGAPAVEVKVVAGVAVPTALAAAKARARSCIVSVGFELFCMVTIMPMRRRTRGV